MDLRQKDKAYIWHPYTSLASESDNIVITSAKGIYLYTDKGEQIIDAISSWWVNLHGHSNDYINKAIAKQTENLEHVIFAGFTHNPAIQLAERLIKILPGDQEKVFYSDNGSTAVEVGIKMALQYWHNQGKNKTRIIALNGGFHGDTFGAMSVGERGPFNMAFQSLLFDVDYCDFPEQGKEEVVLEKFKKLCSNSEVAAFIYEPLVQGASGMRMYSAEILNQLIHIAKQNNIICIADEVMTGFGRTGKLFASEHMVEKPDIICLSKGLTGGYLPMGATACNSKIANAYKSSDHSKTFFHGHSYTANPLCCTVGLASLDLLEKRECLEKLSTINQFHQNFRKNIEGNLNVKEVRICGTILAIELKTKEGTGYFNSIKKYVYDTCLKEGVLLRPLGNIIYILPPYVITENELIKIYKVIEKVIQKLA